jgi:hypothetical protein
VKPVGHSFPDKAFRGEMVAFVELHRRDDAIERGEAVETGDVKGAALKVAVVTSHVLQASLPHEAVNFVAEPEQQFREIGAILSCDAGDESPFHARDVDTRAP